MEIEEDLVTKVAWSYYVNNLTQQQIADQLGIPRLRIIRLLEKARQTGIVQFKVREENSYLSLAHEISTAYDIRDVFIVPSAGNAIERNESIAQAAALYINNRIGDNAFINMGYGDTASRILNHLANTLEKKVSVVSLTGGVNYYLPNTRSSIFSAKLYLMPAPFMMSTAEMATAVMNEPAVREIVEMIPLASMSVVGIGGLDDNATLLRNGLFTKKDLLVLSMQGAVGDVLCNFYDINGQPIDSQYNGRLVTTSIEKLAERNNVIGVGAGPHKVNAIIGALNGKFLDVLITDNETAELILEKTKTPNETQNSAKTKRANNSVDTDHPRQPKAQNGEAEKRYKEE